MKTLKKLFIVVFSLCLIASSAQYKHNVSTFASEGRTETIAFSALADKTFQADFDFTDGDLVRYVLKYGSVESAHNFDAGATNDIYTQAAGVDGVRARNWQWSIVNDAGIIAVFELKANAKLTITREKAGGWPEHAWISIYIKSGDELKLVKSSNITSSGQSDMSLFGGEFHAKEGDTLFYEFAAPTINDGSNRTMEELPTILIDEDAFDINEYENTFPPVPDNLQTTAFSELANATYSADYGMTSGTVFNYGLKHGDISNLKDFDAGGTNDVYTEEESNSGVRAQNWRWQISRASGIIAVFEINIDSKITIVRNFTGGYVENSVISIYIESNSKLTTLKKTSITSSNKNDLSIYGIECYAKQGDIIYYEFRAPEITPGTTRNMQTPAGQDDSLPILTASGDDFDQDAYDEMFRIKEESANLVELVEKAVGVNGETVEYSLFDVDFYGGKLGEGELTRYYAEAVEKTDGTYYYQLLDKEGSVFDDSASSFQTWRMRASTESHAIMAITAKENVFLELTHPQVDGGWTDPKMGIFIGIYLKADNNYYTILEEEPSNEAPANAYGVSVNMKKDDVLYFVYGTLMRSGNINIRPAIKVSTEDYNEANRQQIINGNEKTLSYKDIVSNVISNDFEEVTTTYFKYSLMVGSFYDDDFLRPSYFTGSGQGVPTDGVWDSASLIAGFDRFSLKCSSQYNAIIKVTALQNMLLEMNHEAIWPQAENASIMIVAQDDRGYKWIISDKKIEADSPADYYLLDTHMKAGDSVYIIFYATGSSGVKINLMPVLSVNTQDYQESERPDFERAKAVEDYRAGILEQIEDYVEELGESNYSAARWSEILQIMEEAQQDIRRASTEDDMDALKEQAIAKFNAVNTLEQDLEELNNYKQEKIQELEDYIASLGKKNYSKKNWQLIEEELQNFKDKVELLQNKTAVNTAFTQSKALIDNIEKKKSGCSSNSAVSKLLIFTALVAGLAMIQKRRVF
jgi:hypothetical protein